MGFSVTAAHVVFALAMLAASSVAVGSYWSTQEHLAESRRVQEERILEASRTNITFVGTPSYDAAAGGTLTFTLRNSGGIVLDHTLLQYLFDGAIVGQMAEGYPLIGGLATSSKLLLPGETLDVRMEGIGGEPGRVQVVAHNGMTTTYT